MTNQTETTKPEAPTEAGGQVERVVSRPTATWSVSLDCECPNCEQWVDLLTYPDFWDGRQLDPIEHSTKRSKGVEVACPECKYEFEANLEY